MSSATSTAGSTATTESTATTGATPGDAGGAHATPGTLSREEGGDAAPAASSGIAEVLFGAFVVALVAWLTVSGWRFYQDYVLPEARVVPTITPTPVPDLEALRQEARRLRQVIDYVGAGIAFRQARRPDLAEKEFRNALALDPGNLEARQNLREMGIEPPPATLLNTPVPPTPTILPTVTPRP